MALNYETLDSPYDSFMNRGAEQGASGTSDSLHSLNTAGSEGVPVGSGEGVETATNLGSSQVATTENTAGNGNTENMPTKDSGAISDLWINTFIKSSNWKPKKQGFWLDGPTGYAEFVNVYVSGNINALTGNIGGFIIGPNYITDIADSFGLSSEITGGDDVRFWAGSTFNNKENAVFRVYESGDLFIGNTDSSMSYSTTDGLQVSDFTLINKFITREDISAGNFVVLVGGDDDNKGKIIKGSCLFPAQRRTGIALDSGSPAEIISGGTGFTANVTGTSTTTGGTGSGCVVSYSSNGSGVVISLFIIDYGTGYTDGDVLTLTGGGGNATFTYDANKKIRVVRNGIYKTTGLTAGNLYMLPDSSNVYSTNKTTIRQDTRNATYDASLSVGQTIKLLRISPVSISLRLTSPLGTGSYGYTARFYELFDTEGGPSNRSIHTSAGVTSITRSGSTATVTTTATLPSSEAIVGDYIFIAGANESEYNGWHKILTRPTTTTVTYAVSGTPTTPATGTITYTYRAAKWVVTGNASIVGTGENFITIPLVKNSRYPDSISVYNITNGLIGSYNYLFEFQANNSGELNIGYSNSSVYSSGELWLSGVSDTNKDLAFVLTENSGSGTVSSSGLTRNSIGIARSSTEMIVGSAFSISEDPNE